MLMWKDGIHLIQVQDKQNESIDRSDIQIQQAFWNKYLWHLQNKDERCILLTYSSALSTLIINTSTKNDEIYHFFKIIICFILAYLKEESLLLRSVCQLYFC